METKIEQMLRALHNQGLEQSGVITACTAIAILCLQDAELMSKNSIVPAIMLFLGVGIVIHAAAD